MKKLLAAILVFFTFTALCAKEMNLWCNDNGAEDFATLTVEEQYISYVNTFKNKKDMFGQARKWANRMVGQYGRDVIPFMNETIKDMTFDNVFIEPYDSTANCINYLMYALVSNNILTDIEKELYAQIFQTKIENYILKYRIIDGTVNVTHSFLVLLRGIDTRKETAESWRDYYQERLGIDDIVAGNINQFWH